MAEPHLLTVVTHPLDLLQSKKYSHFLTFLIHTLNRQTDEIRQCIGPRIVDLLSSHELDGLNILRKQHENELIHMIEHFRSDSDSFITLYNETDCYRNHTDPHKCLVSLVNGPANFAIQSILFHFGLLTHNPILIALTGFPYEIPFIDALGYARQLITEDRAGIEQSSREKNNSVWKLPEKPTSDQILENINNICLVYSFHHPLTKFLIQSSPLYLQSLINPTMSKPLLSGLFPFNDKNRKGPVNVLKKALSLHHFDLILLLKRQCDFEQRIYGGTQSLMKNHPQSTAKQQCNDDMHYQKLESGCGKNFSGLGDRFGSRQSDYQPGTNWFGLLWKGLGEVDQSALRAALYQHYCLNDDLDTILELAEVMKIEKIDERAEFNKASPVSQQEENTSDHDQTLTLLSQNKYKYLTQPGEFFDTTGCYQLHADPVKVAIETSAPKIFQFCIEELGLRSTPYKIIKSSHMYMYTKPNPFVLNSSRTGNQYRNEQTEKIEKIEKSPTNLEGPGKLITIFDFIKRHGTGTDGPWSFNKQERANQIVEYFFTSIFLKSSTIPLLFDQTLSILFGDIIAEAFDAGSIYAWPLFHYGRKLREEGGQIHTNPSGPSSSTISPSSTKFPDQQFGRPFTQNSSKFAQEAFQNYITELSDKKFHSTPVSLCKDHARLYFVTKLNDIASTNEKVPVQDHLISKDSVNYLTVSMVNSTFPITNSTLPMVNSAVPMAKPAVSMVNSTIPIYLGVGIVGRATKRTMLYSSPIWDLVLSNSIECGDNDIPIQIICKAPIQSPNLLSTLQIIPLPEQNDSDTYNLPNLTYNTPLLAKDMNVLHFTSCIGQSTTLTIFIETFIEDIFKNDYKHHFDDQNRYTIDLNK